MIKSVIFDIGAVLVEFDWNGFLHRIYDAQTADAVFAATWGTEAWYELDRDALPRETVLGMFTANAPEYAAEIRTALARTNECAKLFPYTPGWIRSLKAQGLSVYFLSNYYPYLVWKNPEVLRFIDDMDGGVFSWQEKITKPDPEIYRRLLRKYDLRAEECVFIDDSQANIDAANALGLHGFRFISYAEQYPQIMNYLAEHTNSATANC